MQRLRIKFSRGPEVKFISPWISSGCGSGFQPRRDRNSYSGVPPHLKSLAAPLPIGVTSEGNLWMFTSSGIYRPPITAVNQQLPPGIRVEKVHPITFNLPSLQSQVSRADYRVEVDTEKGPPDIHSAVEDLLARDHLPWQHQRDTGPHRYDLRALIESICVTSWTPPSGILEMRLRCDSGGSGRPEQVTTALGFSERPRSIHRIQLILKS